MLTTQNDEMTFRDKALREWVTPEFRSMDLMTAAGSHGGPLNEAGSAPG